MIKFQTASVIPPTIPQSGRKGLSSNPSFGFKDDSTRELEDQMSQFQELAGDKRNPLSRVAKLAAVGTGAVVAGLATKASLHATSELVAKTMKSKSVAPRLKRGNKMLKTSKKYVLKKLIAVKDFVVAQYDKLMATKAVRAAKRTFNKYALKFKRTSVGSWASKKFNALKPKASRFVASTKKLGQNVRKSVAEHIPTGAKIKDLTINTVSVGAGLAAGLEGIGMTHQSAEA